MLAQMIKAKAQIFNAVLSKTLMPTCDNLIVSAIGKIALSCELIQGLDPKEKGKGDIFHAANDNLNKIATVTSESDPVISTPQQPEPAPEAAKSPNDSPQPDSALPIDNVVSARKRRRNNYKANKGAQMGAQ